MVYEHFSDDAPDEAFEDLREEQAEIQADKHRGRFLHEYEAELFPGGNWLPPLQSATGDMLLARSGGEPTIPALLQGLQHEQPTQPVIWTDMGGGRGLAQRQAKLHTGSPDNLVTQNIDLFDWDLDGLSDAQLHYLSTIHPGILEDSSKPEVIIADISSVELRQPPQLITSIENVQYLRDPLQTVTHWYNQLDDNGLLVVSREGTWSYDIGYHDSYVERGELYPAVRFANELAASGVPVAATGDASRQPPDWQIAQNGFRSLVIQKVPGTRAEFHGELTERRLARDGFAYVDYVRDETRPFVSVVSQGS